MNFYGGFLFCRVSEVSNKDRDKHQRITLFRLPHQRGFFFPPARVRSNSWSCVWNNGDARNLWQDEVWGQMAAVQKEGQESSTAISSLKSFEFCWQLICLQVDWSFPPFSTEGFHFLHLHPMLNQWFVWPRSKWDVRNFYWEVGNNWGMGRKKILIIES